MCAVAVMKCEHNADPSCARGAENGKTRRMCDMSEQRTLRDYTPAEIAALEGPELWRLYYEARGWGHDATAHRRGGQRRQSANAHL